MTGYTASARPQRTRAGLASEWLPPLLLFVGSLYSMPQTVFVAAAVLAFLLRRQAFLSSVHFRILAVIVILSILNFIYGAAQLPDVGGGRNPYFMAYLFSFLMATQMNRRDLQIVTYLLTFEAATVGLEAILGVNTIFSSNPEYRSGLSFEMLYFARPFGLSDGVNTLGGKLVIGIVFADYLLEHGVMRNVLRAIFAGALILNFSRTALLAVLVHYLIFFFVHYRSRYKWLWPIVLVSIVVVLGVTTGVLSLEQIANQFNRGKEDGVDLSFRDIIWQNCLDFIMAHPWFGNGSSRYYVFISDYGKWEHAHNSFLHLFSANGILIGSLTCLWLASNVNRVNIKFVTPILIFSAGQYGIFWGISFLDVLFLFLILSNWETLGLALSGTKPTVGTREAAAANRQGAPC
jgi:O-antigen ligase